MKSTGIVRRVDELGRIVIPKEMRRTMKIRDGDSLEIYTGENGEVIFRKYSPLVELGEHAIKFSEVLHRNIGHPVVLCDRDSIIAVAGISKKETLFRRVSSQLEDCMEQRKAFDNTNNRIPIAEGVDLYVMFGIPILSSGDVIGAIMYLGDESSPSATDMEIKLVSVVAALLGNQIEE
jgi:AbrB family transcriptional regulator (stage V sporulation protein T)